MPHRPKPQPAGAADLALAVAEVDEAAIVAVDAVVEDSVQGEATAVAAVLAAEPEAEAATALVQSFQMLPSNTKW